MQYVLKFAAPISKCFRRLCILPKKLRKAMSQLRLSSNSLYVETGRYSRQRIDRSQRYCTFCNSQDIEDEFHFGIEL